MAGGELVGVHSGRFWLAETPDTVVAGRLDLSGRWPRLELFGTLTPYLQIDPLTTPTDGNQVTKYVPVSEGPESQSLTVHGQLVELNGKITLAGMWTAGRTGLGVPGRQPADQWLEGRYAVRGAHEPGAEARFTCVRLRVRHLDTWAALPGFFVEFDDRQTLASLRYEQIDVPTVPLPHREGVIGLDQVLSKPLPTVRGGAITRAVHLTLTGLGEGLTIAEIWQDIVEPVSTILTLAVDADCPPVTLHVAHDANRPWLQVFHPGLEPDPDPGTGLNHPLLTRRDLGLVELAAWLDRAPNLRPLPALIAGIYAASAPRIPNQVLELATAAEGLHRRLRPDERRASTAQADRVRAAVANARDLEKNVRQAALGLLEHFEEPSYNSRLRSLLERAGAAVPGLNETRRPSDDQLPWYWRQRQWREAVSNARNGFAHWLDHPGAGTAEDVDLLKLAVLRDSLRWLLSSVLLLEAGVPADHLRSRLSQHRPYARFIHEAAHTMPKTFRDAAP